MLHVSVHSFEASKLLLTIWGDLKTCCSDSLNLYQNEREKPLTKQQKIIRDQSQQIDKLQRELSQLQSQIAAVNY